MKYLILIFAVCGLMTGCAVPPQPVPVTQTQTTLEEEQRLWRRAQEEQDAINSSGVLYQDAEIENYLSQIALKLQKNSISPDISFQIKVVKNPDLNAFAFPNGVIYLHTGILARMDNEAQLAALLAHEMVHCTHRHSLRTRRNIKDRAVVRASIRQRSARAETGYELAQIIGITGSIATISGYTRELETEADRIGLDLMIKANYDPREVLKLFELMKKDMEIEGIEEPYFFGSHPNVRQRVKNVNNWLAESYRGITAGVKNTGKFQSRMSRLVLDNAHMELRRGRFSFAQKAVEKFLAFKQNEARAYFLMGEILRQRGRKDEASVAMKYYEKSISLDPSLPEPHKAMGLIHYKDGEKLLAKKYFESCLLLSPNAIDKAYIRGYLKLCATSGEG